MNNTTALKALDEAVQLAEIASDWNLDEVEIDGEMVSIYDLRHRFKVALDALKVEQRPIRLDGAALREGLAEYAHEAWAGWMKWMFEEGGYSTIQADDNGKTMTFWTMKPEKYERWQRQMNTPYADLPDGEKESDRLEADRMIEVMDRTPLEQP